LIPEPEDIIMEEAVRDITGVRILSPETVKIFRGTFNMLHVMVIGDTLYRGVFAVQAFPLSMPRKFISLFYFDERDRPEEIGVIEDLNAFPSDARDLVVETLEKYYFSYEIIAIHRITWQFGLLHFDVETDKGRKDFYMRWEHSRAVDYGENGKILLDVFDDRYVISNVDALSKAERQAFTRYIFW